MSADQEQWMERLRGLGLKPSISDSSCSTDELDVPCPTLPGIKARFIVYGGGNKNNLAPGIYLNVGILPIGISTRPLVRDAVSEFVIRALTDPKNTPSAERQFGPGIEFDMIGSTMTGSTILRLRTSNPEDYRNLGELVESEEHAMRVTPFKGGIIPPSSD